MSTLPALAALAASLHSICPTCIPGRSNRGEVAEVLLRKAAYLNVAFFDARAAIYFAMWSRSPSRCAAIGSGANERGRHADDACGPCRSRAAPLRDHGDARGRRLVMSLSADWYSTTFGLLVMVSQAYAAFSFAIACAVSAGDVRPATGREGHTAGDLGNLLLTFAMIWAYLAFTQFLIIWAEDLPKEIDWYVARSSAFWKALAIAVLGLKFVVPFVAMLFRSFKREPHRLAGLCAALLIGQGLEISG